VGKRRENQFEIMELVEGGARKAAAGAKGITANSEQKLPRNRCYPLVTALRGRGSVYTPVENGDHSCDLFRADKIALEQYDKPSRGLWRITTRGHQS
jgi:hypothetical protein